MPTSSEHSLGATSFRHESWEFDSGARDLSPEPNTLYKLIEAAGISLTANPNQLLDVANKVSEYYVTYRERRQLSLAFSQRENDRSRTEEEGG